MADEAELRPFETGPGGDDAAGHELLHDVPPAEVGAGTTETTVQLCGTPVGFVLTAEPPSGFYIRARYAGHHTAGFVWHRDDAEGHPASYLPQGPPEQVWWSHEESRWVSWEYIQDFVAANVHGLVLEPLFSPPQLPGCVPHGLHSPSRCVNPDPGILRK